MTLPSYLLTFSRDYFKIESASSHESTYSSNTELDCTLAHLVSHINNVSTQHLIEGSLEVDRYLRSTPTFLLRFATTAPVESKWVCVLRVLYRLGATSRAAILTKAPIRTTSPLRTTTATDETQWDVSKNQNLVSCLSARAALCDPFYIQCSLQHFLHLLITV